MKKKSIHGFTIVEITIIVPIAILAIGVFITAIVSMTGDVLSTRASNALAYTVQDALNRIEQDVNYSDAFLPVNNITLTSPQGYNDDTTNFHNADATNGTMLILKTFATTSNPLGSARNLVYNDGQPYQCSNSQINKNTPLTLNIVYFVKNNTLWRRVIAPTAYQTIGCSVPWQKPSCAPGYSTPSFCKAQDMRMVDNIVASTGFSVKYYSTTSPTAQNTIASDSAQTDSARLAAMQTTNMVSVTISSATTIAGRDISQSGTTRAVSPNNKVSSILNCPSGFIIVPGNGTYGTSDFCAMKYEAKADDNGDGIGDTNQSTTSNTWPNDTYPISATRKLVSTAAGYPVANINQTNAISYAANYTYGCSSGCHLITEAEWMTIAQNVLSVPSNWTGGSVGNGEIYSGNNDNVPSVALQASTDDNGYFGTGNSSPSNQLRTLTLTNGEVIWDMAGNIDEWTQGTIAGGQQPGLSGESAYAWKEWNNSSLLMNGLPFISQPVSTGLTGASSWSSAQGIGQLNSNYGQPTGTSFRRSGSYYADDIAGILKLDLSCPSTNVSATQGLRVTK